ncbi:MAG: GTPase domain-containing protein [Gemmataceae bacterium]|nr:GTPase domain-containing protein [Gemmataceae bacterium]
MDPAALRTAVNQLSDDFAWLEDHVRSRANHELQLGALRLAAAVVRNVLGPALEKQPALPLHVAVVGGAGAGKSTVSNMLMGSMLAESNPQAGFTRHPIAYLKGNAEFSLPTTLGFLGPLRRLDQSESARLDQDVWQVRRVSVDPDQLSLLDKFVVWDCPDMTTWAATGYVPRLLEVCGLADVIIYVASDERYNDEVPTQYLRLLLEAGKTVVVMLMKMRATDVPAFLAHFEKEVVSKLPGGPVAIMATPQLTFEQLSDPIRKAMDYRVPLLNQVLVLGTPADAARKRTLTSGLRFLTEGQAKLLSVARADLEAMDSWRSAVQLGQTEFENRYRREYLTSEQFRRFDEALVRLLDLLELPGVGRFFSTAVNVITLPITWAKNWFVKAISAVKTPAMPERPVLEAGLAAWSDGLRREGAAKAQTHPLWKHINDGFRQGLDRELKQRFEASVNGFQASLHQEVDRCARAIYEDLHTNPVALNTLRGAKFALQVAAIITPVITLGIGNVLNFVLVPLAAAVAGQLVELLGHKYVDFRREETRSRQQAMMSAQVSSPLGQWLLQWPTTGGSIYEKLQHVLRRIPENLNAVKNVLK